MALYDVSTNEKKASPSLVAGGTLWADSPIGTILPYGGEVSPSGWFLCQGQSISRTTYSDLFAVIGESFGAGDGSTTFNLPDMRESVPKGAGLTGHTVGAHLDADGLAVGEFLDDRVQEHQHDNPNDNASGNQYGKYTYVTGSKTGFTGNFENHINSGRSGATTEVKSVGVNYIIKAKMIGVPADFLAKVDEAVEDVYGDIIPSDASASNKLVTESDLSGFGTPIALTGELPAQLTSNFNATSNMGIFQGVTGAGNEGAWYGFKRNATYGTALFVGNGYIGKLTYNGTTWTLYKIF